MPAEGFFLMSCRTPKAVSQRHWLSSNLSKHRKSTIWESSRWWKTAATYVNADNICDRSCVRHTSSKEKAYRHWREASLLGKSSPRRWGLTLSSQESYHCLLNFCSFSHPDCVQTRPAEAQPAANHRGEGYKCVTGKQKGSTWDLDVCKMLLRTPSSLLFFFQLWPLSLLALLLYGQREWIPGGMIRSYFNRKQELEGWRMTAYGGKEEPGMTPRFWLWSLGASHRIRGYKQSRIFQGALL